MIIKHKTLGEWEINLENVTQGKVESFFKTLRTDHPDNANITGVEYQGDTVRVAMKLGWITPKFVIDDVSPAQIRFIATEIQRILSEALTVDPN